MCFFSHLPGHSEFGDLSPRQTVYQFRYLHALLAVVKLLNLQPSEIEGERNVLFNDALNTFYQRLYGVRHMVKDHYDSEKGNPLPPHRLLLLINSKGSFICTIPDRITHTTAFVTPVVEHCLEREIGQWVHPMKDRSDDPSHHERTLYLWAMSRSPSEIERCPQPYCHYDRHLVYNALNTFLLMTISVSNIITRKTFGGSLMCPFLKASIQTDKTRTKNNITSRKKIILKSPFLHTTSTLNNCCFQKEMNKEIE